MPNTHLRLLEDVDVNELFLLTDANRSYLRQWLPWIDQTVTVLDTERFLANSRLQREQNKGFQAAVIHERKIAGMIGFHNLDWMNRSVMIGYWLAPEFQGKGLMTEACALMVDIAFHHYKLNRVEIRCATGNSKSCAIPERLGFAKEGIIRQGEWLYDRYVDLVIYSMLAGDWRTDRANIFNHKPEQL